MGDREITIERVEELRLNKATEAQIAELLDTTFTTDFGGRSFFQNRHHCRFIAFQKGELVGHLSIAYRAIQMGRQRVDIVGIGEVAVAAKARKQGIATELVHCAIEEGKAAEADFAALFGEESLYSKAGFVKGNNNITLSEMEGARTGTIVRENNPYFMIRPLGKLEWDFNVPVDLAGFSF